MSRISGAIQNNHTDSSDEAELVKPKKSQKTKKNPDPSQDDGSVEENKSPVGGDDPDSDVEDDTNSEGADDRKTQSISESVVKSSTRESAEDDD